MAFLYLSESRTCSPIIGAALEEIIMEDRKAGEALEQIEAVYRGDGKSSPLTPTHRPMK
jgi:hypothetical protein